MKKLSLICLTAFVVLLALLGGCATHTPLDVGQVVVAPKAKLPAPPVIVQQTEPKPVGYFQCLLLTYLQKPCESQTASTPPTPAAVQTRTQ